MAKQWKKIDDMTSEERDNFTGRHILRLFLMNGLWLLFVLIMLFVMFPLGIVLLIITVLKYRYDYYDTKSQNAFSEFNEETERKRSEEEHSSEQES